MQDVVRAAGVTKGAKYHYFPSKDGLLHEIYWICRWRSVSTRRSWTSW